MIFEERKKGMSNKIIFFSNPFMVDYMQYLNIIDDTFLVTKLTKVCTLLRPTKGVGCTLVTNIKLELMFMKHYAPNRCLYIKVAKLRTGVGSAEMSHLQNRCLKISG